MMQKGSVVTSVDSITPTITVTCTLYTCFKDNYMTCILHVRLTLNEEYKVMHKVILSTYVHV